MQRAGSWNPCGCRHSFNPHPASRPDATPLVKSVRSLLVTFQSSPGLPAGCNWTYQHPVVSGEVSILTRPPGRMQLKVLAMTLYPSQFQSSPGLPAGCNTFIATSRGMMASFNPHPASRPDATRSSMAIVSPSCSVSILTRPPGRMQRHILDRMCRI